MALQKQTVEITFNKGIDTKTDPFRLPIGNFTSLVNGVFDKLGLLEKRNGFDPITSLPTAASFLTTFNGNLTALGTNLQAYSAASNSWINTGSIQPIQLSTLPLIRNAINQNHSDTAISSNGLVCTAYTESDGSTTTHKYAIADATTGQNVVAPTAIASDATYGHPRVFSLGKYFIILYVNQPAAYNLKYVAVNQETLVANAAVTVSTSITPASTLAFDGYVYNNSLYIAWNGAGASGIKATTLSSILVLGSVVNPDAAHVATMVSVTADTSNGDIWVSYYNLGTTAGYTLVLSSTALATILAATAWVAAGTILNITSAAQSGSVTIFYELSTAYSYDSGIATNIVKYRTCTRAGSLGTAAISIRSLGLASKAFIISSTIYYLGVYSSPYQPTYFLVNGTSSLSTAPVITAKLAYTIGGGYLTSGLPSVAIDGTTASISYLIKDLIQAANKNTNVPSGSQVNGIYTQVGINLVSFNLTTNGMSVVEIGQNLNISGGFMSMFDGYVPVEQNFFVYPDSVEVTTATGSGGLIAQKYYYQVTYEWADNQGNIHRSAPSIPVSITTTTASSTNTINVPTLRLTAKTANPVKIVVYRWSTAQQTYYQVTSLSVPTLNSFAADSVAVVDALADATILGNNIIYTNGGVVENENAPSANATTIFDTRVWVIDAEDPNLLRYSKQVIEATPVEMSGLFTLYVAPSSSVQHTTGPMRCIFPMDDKLIIFKDASIYYINGRGPDNTGANSQYSEPIFITSTVGCTNLNSIVLTPNGIMFQSQNGIWLLNRGLGTQYIGAPMEAYNSATVLSAIAIPGTNRVLFALDTNITLMYDHFVGQWGTFEGMSNISSTIYQGMHTYLSAPVSVTPSGAAAYTTAARVFQETPGLYLDGSRPVTMSFVTGWLSLAGVQGYQRAYWFDILGTYISPHTIGIGIAYDYSSSISQRCGVEPDNYSAPWGGDATWGSGSLWGGTSAVEQWEIYFQQQKCQAFQITLQEYYDASLGVPAGAGLKISSLNLVVGLKKPYTRNIPVSHSTG